MESGLLLLSASGPLNLLCLLADKPFPCFAVGLLLVHTSAERLLLDSLLPKAPSRVPPVFSGPRWVTSQGSLVEGIRPPSPRAPSDERWGAADSDPGERTGWAESKHSRGRTRTVTVPAWLRVRPVRMARS